MRLEGSKTRLFHENITKLSFFSKKITKKFGGNKKISTFAIPNENKTFETTFPNSSVG